MRIDPAAVQWDEAPAIDPNAVQWDSAPRQGVRGYAPMRFEGDPKERAKTYLPQGDMQPSDMLLNAMIAAKKAGDTAAERILRSEYDFAEAQANDPTKSIGTAQLFGEGASASLMRLGRGAGQLVGLSTQEDEAEARRLEAPLMNSGAGFAGNVTGTVGQVALPGAVLKTAGSLAQTPRLASGLNAASRVFLPSTPLGATTSGAAFGALQPVVAEGERFRNTVYGAGAGFGGAAIPRIVSGARNALGGLTGADRGAAQVMREAVPNVDDVVASAVPSRVPGVQRTLAESTLDPNVINLDRGVRATGSTRLSNQALANNQARVSQLQRIAGTEDDLVSAIAARNVGTAPLRSQALKAENVDITTALSRLSKAEKALEGNPSLQSGIAKVRGLLANANKKAPDTPASPILDASGKPMTPAVKGASLGADMQQLYNIRNEIGQMLSGVAGGESKDALKNARQLILARESIDNAISARVPEFKQYLSEFQRLSGDVNRLQFGQELMRSAVKDLGDAGASIMPGQFMAKTAGLTSTNPRAGANRLAQTATGFRKAKAGNVLPAPDSQMIGAIRDDIGREIRAGQIASLNAGGGSQTALLTELKQGMVRKLSRSLPLGIGEVVEKLEKGAQERLALAVADALADPIKARAILSRFPANERRVVSDTFAALGISSSPVQASGQNRAQAPSKSAGQ